MNNYSKMTLVVFSALFLMLLASFVSAYPSNAYRDVSETVSYNEDLEGGNRGFSLTHKSSMPRTNPAVGCDYYDWTSDFRKCRRTAYYNGYMMEDYYGYSNSNTDNRAYYDQDKALKEAFKTYQQSSKQQFQLESQRINMAQRRYSYGGYGYGYSGAYYRYGW